MLIPVFVKAQINCPENLPVTVVGNTSYCVGSPGANLSVEEPYDSYEWLPTAQNTQSALLTLGNYELVVTHYTGCTDTIDIEIDQVANPPQPTITAAGPLEFCAGESVTLSGPSGFAGYTWNSGSVGREITVYESGTFVLSVTDFIGCSSSSNSLQVIVDPDPVAQFSPDLNGFGIEFNNLSVDATDYLWNFGDGNTSTDFEPVYSYSDTGMVDMYLVASNNCGSDTAFLTLNSVDVEEIGNEQTVRLYPNPGMDEVHIKAGQPVNNIRIHNMLGKVTGQWHVASANGTNLVQLNVSDLRPGMYVIVYQVGGQLHNRKWLKR